jgi:carbon storage regulator
MLVLTRKTNEAILIGEDVRVVVISIERDKVKLGIEAPALLAVKRSEEKRNGRS